MTRLLLAGIAVLATSSFDALARSTRWWRHGDVSSLAWISSSHPMGLMPMGTSMSASATEISHSRLRFRSYRLVHRAATEPFELP